MARGITIGDKARKSIGIKGRAIYPWKQWFKRKRFTLTRGIDYHCQDHGMRSSVIRAAGTKGVRVQLRTGEGVIHVKVIGTKPPAKPISGAEGRRRAKAKAEALARKNVARLKRRAARRKAGLPPGN